MIRPRFFLFLLFSVIGIGVGIFFIPRCFQKQAPQRKVASVPVAEQKSFVIIIPSYNNAKFIEKNLRSVFSQNYENYRVIYIDDNSSDETLAKAAYFLKQLDHKNRTTLIHNPVNFGALANIYNAVHSCQDQEIVVLVDGDDYLAHEEVLNKLNQTYADPSTWLTYGNYLDYPSFKQDPPICNQIPDKVIEKRLFRKTPWVSTHLRTFYASLFKQIKIEDLFYRGRFFAMGWDLAFMLPLLEMAGPHSTFIEDCLYLYNRENPISDHKINFAFQQACSNAIRARPSYPPLKKIPSTATPSKETADLLIFSEDHPLQLSTLLKSVEQHVVGLNKISVLYRTSSLDYDAAYQELKSLFPKVDFVQQKQPSKGFKTLCTQLVFAPPLSESRYILFALDSLVIQEQIDLSKGIDALNQTGAYGLFLGHHAHLQFSHQLNRYQPIPPFFPLTGIEKENSLNAWQFSAGTDDWASPQSLHFTLYRKEDLKKDFFALDYDSPHSLSTQWGAHAPTDRIGLFFTKAKAVAIVVKNTQR